MDPSTDTTKNEQTPPGQMLGDSVHPPADASGQNALEVLRAIVRRCNDGEPVGFEQDFGGNTLTVFVGDGHTHVGVPDGREEDLFKGLYALFCRGRGLSFAPASDHIPTPPPMPIPVAGIELLARRAYPDLKPTGGCSRHQEAGHFDCLTCYPDMNALLAEHGKVFDGLYRELLELSGLSDPPNGIIGTKAIVAELRRKLFGEQAAKPSSKAPF